MKGNNKLQILGLNKYLINKINLFFILHNISTHIIIFVKIAILAKITPFFIIKWGLNIENIIIF